MKKIALALLLTLSTALPSAASSPMAVLQNLKGHLARVTDLGGRFTQTTTLEAAGMDKVTAGKVVFKRGLKMKWEYEGADPQTIVSDGKTVWVYQARDKTAVHKDVEELSPASRAALDLLGGTADMEKHFSLSSCGENCIEMKPLVPDPDLSLIRLYVKKEGGLAKVATEDAVGNKTTVELDLTDVNKGVPDSFFIFEPPKGVDVFDSRGRQR